MAVPVQLTEARQKAEAARKQIEEAQKVMAESVQEALTDGMNGLFERYPFLGSVRWTQYTPYFNDGEPCVFHVHFYPGISSVKDIEDDTESTYSEEYGEDFYLKCNKEKCTGFNSETRTSQYVPNDSFDPEYKACEEEITELFKSLQGERTYGDTPSAFESAMLQAFGDHATITINRDGIEVGDCEHE